MFLISKDEGLTHQRLGKILEQFQTNELPRMNNSWNYYVGKQPILQKRYSDKTKPCNKVVVNYCYSIVKNYLGYLTGIPIQYDNKDFEEVFDILKYNDVVDEDTEFLRQALIFGRSFEINYVDEEGKQRFRTLETRQCVPVYWNNLNNDLAYVVRFYREDLVDENIESYIVEVYGDKETVFYKSGPGFSTFTEIGREPNFYNQVPITVFSLNKDEEPIFNQIISLQNAYNDLYSGSIDDFAQFADAYLVIKGAIADEDDLQSMKENRVIMIDPDADASYLTKSISDTALQDILKLADDQIHTISNSPNFNDEKFMSQSGIAMRYKLVGFETTASAIENAMRKALQKRIELICSVLSIVSGEQVWRDVEIVFTRNLPLSLDPSTPDELMKYKGLVSDETLLAQIPFVNDVDEEMKKVKKQNEENMSLYQFEGEVNSELLDKQGNKAEREAD